jgi:hypothetical protein
LRRAGTGIGQSLGEDMELITRMRKLMHQKGEVLDIYIPEPLFGLKFHQV